MKVFFLLFPLIVLKVLLHFYQATFTPSFCTFTKKGIAFLYLLNVSESNSNSDTVISYSSERSLAISTSDFLNCLRSYGINNTIQFIFRAHMITTKIGIFYYKHKLLYQSRYSSNLVRIINYPYLIF